MHRFIQPEYADEHYVSCPQHIDQLPNDEWCRCLEIWEDEEAAWGDMKYDMMKDEGLL